MRLTLRTLLAYLDDRLSPTNARELGQKLAKSPFATELAERIKSVVRRRRLAKESLEHKSIDANLIAEYLDDQLTPELISLIEKEILASDQSLAEVAATHQILGLLRDPVEIDEGLKERLYALGPQSEADDGGSEAGTAPASNSEAAGWQPLERQTGTQTRSPMVLLIVMVLGWLVLLATDSNLFSDGDQVASIEPVGDDSAAPDPQRSEETSIADTDPEDEEKSSKTELGTTTPTDGESDKPTDMSDTNVVAKVEPDTTATEKPVADSTDSGAPKMVGEDSETPNVVVVDPPQKPAGRLELTDDFQMLALEDPEDQAWVWASTVVAPGTEWMTELSARLASVSAPYAIQLIAPKSGWSIELIGPATFRVADASTGALQVLEGRLLLKKYAAEVSEPFDLRAGRQKIQVAIPDGEGVIAIEVIPIPTGAEPGGDEDDLASLLPIDNYAMISVTSPDTDAGLMLPGLNDPLVVARGTTWQWSTTAAVTAEGQTAVQSLVPEWIYDQQAVPTELEAELHRNIAAGYRKEETVSNSAVTLAADKNPRVAAFAVGQLALARNVDLLVGLLLQSDESTTRQQAIASLQQIMHQTPAGHERIQAALDTRLPEMEQENVLKLISGISLVAAEDRQESVWLVDMLENSRVATRELAIFNLERLFGDRKGYFASDDAARRDRAVTRWKSVLRDNDGRLIVPGQEPESN